MPTDSFDERVAELHGEGDAVDAGTDRTPLALMQDSVTMHGIDLDSFAYPEEGDTSRHE
jgi:hypothetical protein